MKKRILLFLLSIMLVLPCTLALSACGQKEISGYHATAIEGTEYTYDEDTKTFTISSNKNFRDLLNSAFNVSVIYKDNTSEKVEYKVDINTSAELDSDCTIKVFVGEIEVETFYLKLTDKEQVLLEYLNSEENLTFEYANEEIDVLEQIKLSNTDLENAISSGKVILKENSKTKATEINYNTDEKYSFTLVANPGYYFIKGGNQTLSVTYDWYIKQKTVAVMVPKAKSYSLEFIPGANFRGGWQTIELYYSEDEEENEALKTEFEKYFDLSDEVFDDNEARYVGEYAFNIELNDEYKNNSNYFFDIITDSHSSVTTIGGNKQINISWQIHKLNLGIDGFEVIYDEEDPSKDAYPYTGEIIVPVTNVDEYRGKLFTITIPKASEETEGMVDVDRYPITIETIAPFVAESYCFNNNQTIENATIYFNICKGTYVIDDAIDEISDLRNGEYRDGLTFKGYWNLLNNRPVDTTGDLALDYTVFKQMADVLDLIGGWKIYTDEQQELITGENIIRFYYYQNNLDTQWNPTEFYVKLVIEPQPFEVKLDWGNSTLTYAEDGEGNPTILGKEIITKIYSNGAWIADDSNFNLSVVTKKKDSNNEYTLNADGYVGYYKTTATLSWKFVNDNGTKNRYLFTSDVANENKGDLVVSFEWQIVPQQIETDIVTINRFIREVSGENYYWGYDDVNNEYFAFLTEDNKPFNYTLVSGIENYVAEGENLDLSVLVNNIPVSSGEIIISDLGEHNIKVSMNYDQRKYSIATQQITVVIKNTNINVSNLDFATSVRSKSNKGTLEISVTDAAAGDGIPYKLVGLPYGVGASYVFVNAADSEDVLEDLTEATAGTTYLCSVEGFNIDQLIAERIDGIGNCTVSTTWQNSPITIKVVE